MQTLRGYTYNAPNTHTRNKFEKIHLKVTQPRHTRPPVNAAYPHWNPRKNAAYDVEPEQRPALELKWLHQQTSNIPNNFIKYTQ